MRLKYFFVYVWPLCFAIVNAGIQDFDPIASAQAQTQTPASVKTISISMQPQVPISSLMYGVNYVWATTPASQFTSWIYQMSGAGMQPSGPASLSRYPGGWDGEWYDWDTNEMYSGGPTYTEPGEPPDQFLDYMQPLAMGTSYRAASFQLPVRDVVQAGAKVQIAPLISQLIAKYVGIIKLYNGSVKFWELGNEWWLQNGAGNNTAPLSSNALLSSNLARYAAIVAAAAPIIKTFYPNIKLYVTADWTTAGAAAADDEFVQLRKQVGQTAWALIDGISVHSYCGTTVQASLCTALPQQIGTIKQETGKSDIYASEWAVVINQSTNDFGIRNANATVSALQEMALAGITKAAYWPSIGSVPNIALTTGTSLTSTGIIFLAMSQLYEGHAIPTQIAVNSGPAGQTAAVAAENVVGGKNSLAVIIPTNGDGLETINLSLAGTGFTKVVGSWVEYSQNPDLKVPSTIAYTVPLSVSMTQGQDGNYTAQFVLNPGTPGRGSNWEIAMLQLQ